MLDVFVFTEKDEKKKKQRTKGHVKTLLIRILPLYVMIVKLQQNFTKMREFNRIRDQKKIKLKIFIVYEI